MFDKNIRTYSFKMPNLAAISHFPRITFSTLEISSTKWSWSIKWST